MNRSKNILTLGLMISSVVLLVTLQFLWLRGSYEKAFFDFRRETSMLFRTTVFNLRDSLFIKNIEPAWDDTTTLNAGISRVDSFKIKLLRTDTLIDGRDGNSKFQVFIDSSYNYLKPLAGAVHRMQGRRSFVIRIGPDTVSVDTLAVHFAKALAPAGIAVPFKVEHSQIPATQPARRLMRSDDYVKIGGPGIYLDTLHTEYVPLNPMHQYSASFTGMRSAILKEITPQILFACFLTLMIVASFVIMYRNIAAQQRLMELKNDFISNVTHELKTPVATVSVALEALKDFNALQNPERTKEYLNIALNELNRLTLMTDKILKASAFETQGLSFIPEKVNIHSIIDQVVSSMKLVFEKKKLTVNFHSEGTDFDLEGSELHLTNVVYNLVDNALKYSPENSTIDIRLKNTTDRIELLVSDFGIGIPKEYHKKVFEKFFGVPTGDVHNVKGYGLGLNYVAGVVKSHHGSIGLDSEPGKGSTFTIILPRKHG